MRNNQLNRLTASKKIIFSIVTLMLGLIILELILRLAGLFPTEKLFEKRAGSSSWQENLFAGFMGIHEPDPVLLWKMKPNLKKDYVTTNARSLTGPLVPYTKTPGKLRILVLGDSTPLGIGLPSWSNSFVWLIQQFLKSRYNLDAEVINASTAGYSSLQGLKYLQVEGLKYHPDIVLIYLGNNDASYNGYSSDADLMAQANQYIGVKRFLNHFKIYGLLKSILLPLKSKYKADDGGPLQMRVSPDAYTQNLNQIIDLCADNDIKVILNTIPVPLTWPPGVEFKVFTTGRDTISGQIFMPEHQREMLSRKMALALDWDMFSAQYGQIDPWSQHVLNSAYSDTGDINANIARYRSLMRKSGDNSRINNNIGVLYWRSEQFDSARIYLSRALADNPQDPAILYNLGIDFLNMGIADSSEYYLNQARDNDYNSLRIKSNYNAIIRSVANGKGLPFIDLVALFDRIGREKLFVDHCHPNQTGHRIIAEQFADMIMQIKNK